MEHFYNTIELWYGLLERVNDYVFGEPLDEELFAEAMKGTFEVFNAVYNMDEIRVEESDGMVNALQLLRLTCLMSEYMADRYTADEDNEKFRASQLVVRLVLGRITNNFQWHEDGIFPVYELEYYYGEDDKLVYDVQKGNLSDMISALQFV